MKSLAPPPASAIAFREDPLAFLEHLSQSGQAVAPLPFRMHGGDAALVNDPALAARLLADVHFQKWNAFSGIPETLGRGILTSEDPIHAQVRRAVQPAFHAGMADAWTQIISSLAAEAIGSELSPGARDIHPFFQRLALRIAGRILFALDLDAFTADLLASIAELQQFYDARDYAPAADQRFTRARNRLAELLADILESQPDALRDGPVFRMLAESPDIPRSQIPDEFHSILLAGSVTTAATLAGACVRLANDPVNVPLDDAGLDAVFCETLRLAPPAWLHMREATCDGVLGDVSYRAGDRFMVCTWSLHRRPESFPEPHAFRPERWLAGLERKLPPGAFLPFSVGPRSCLGARFARLEATIVLRALLARFRITPAHGHPPLRWLPRVTLVPANGAWITLSHHHD
ncbi:MAG: cytochrome P450 [Chthoniobacterales bacterium]